MDKLRSIEVEPFIIDIEKLGDNIQSFLKADVLIINIPLKNTEAFKELIKEIEKSEIENVIFVSSTSVYNSSNKTLTENDVDELIDKPLLRIEKLFAGNKNFESTILRFGGLIGYSRNPARFFKDGRIVKNPEGYVNMIHRDDCIGIITSIIKKDIWNEVFNCCANTHPTKREFYTYAAESSGENIPNFADSDEIQFKIVSNQKVKSVLNYEFMHPDLMKIRF